MTDPVCVGVDGGGSGSRARAVAPGGEVLAREEGGPAAVSPGAPDAAALRVRDLVDRVLRSAGSGPPAEALCAALAGVGRPEPRSAVEEALSRSGVARAVRVETDFEAAHRDAFGSGDGILLVAGTGSVALARGSGRTARAGGWGPILGDEGGGYDLARRALRAVARAADGRAPPTLLAGRISAETGMEGPADLVGGVAGAGRERIAALAPVVIRAAEDGDPVAGRLVEEATAALASAVLAARRACGPDRPSRVALSGGLVGEGGPLRRRAADRLRGLGLEVLPGTASSLDGACLRARELAGA